MRGAVYFDDVTAEPQPVINAVSAQRQRTTKHGTSVVGDIFRTNCARCHGADGRGDTPLGHTYNAPDFTDSDWWHQDAKTKTRANLVSIVSRGKRDMPAFGKKLPRSQIDLLVEHVLRFRKSD